MPHRRLRELRIDLPPEMLAKAQREALREYRLAVSGVVAIGIVAMFAGLSFFLDPASVDRSVIGRQLSGPADQLWSALWVVGGAAIMAGAVKPWRWVELCGQMMFAVASLMYGVAVVSVSGTLPPVFLAAALTLATCARSMWLILYGPQLIKAKPERRQSPRGTVEDRRS